MTYTLFVDGHAKYCASLAQCKSVARNMFANSNAEIPKSFAIADPDGQTVATCEYRHGMNRLKWEAPPHA